MRNHHIHAAEWWLIAAIAFLIAFLTVFLLTPTKDRSYARAQTHAAR